MSESESDSGEKIHDPTPKKLDDARCKGNIARSPDILAATSYLGLLIGLSIFGAGQIDIIGSSLARIFAEATTPQGMSIALKAMQNAFIAAASLIALPIALIIAALIAQRGILVTGSNLAPKLDRISILKGFGRKFGATGLFEFAKSTTKLLILSVALGIWFDLERDRLIGLSAASAGTLAIYMGKTVLSLLTVATIVAGSIAIVDFLWQRFDHQRKLRMSHQDLRDESKDSEGDPHQKAQRRQRAQELASNRMLQDVPAADVVLVNPTEIAIALKWDRTQPGAPICVAKGQGEIAARIRELAAENGIPTYRDIPTARMLYADLPVGAEIPHDTYRAVAAAIRFADKMRSKAR